MRRFVQRLPLDTRFHWMNLLTSVRRALASVTSARAPRTIHAVVQLCCLQAIGWRYAAESCAYVAFMVKVKTVRGSRYKHQLFQRFRKGHLAGLYIFCLKILVHTENISFPTDSSHFGCSPLETFLQFRTRAVKQQGLESPPCWYGVTPCPRDPMAPRHLCGHTFMMMSV